ncbi:tRNA threonylcarbamoyladenosine dehydratase [Pusillimonas sp. CC-YST705]|uniref:tRNA threonylcarbamoyladenosine dehydratase n=1 Tax=Mesopusillimonas faecipullorum TaxID=2755040 RepID=A0ABS8CES1_9BURK|nr:tRNA threonylcarbamoyladenosine dehydratase [Mesopusillimonas faecipullorum]MCB5364527.1 tRNA threonylcarbamoyladenosine dehydratase [Mesopusillimonas faecipullorum]
MSDSSLSSFDPERRFGGMSRLYGPEGARRLEEAHVAVAGLGGVGSWCAEALARSGVGRLTLIDLDHVAESNINRQVHALDDTIGQSKVQAMADRIRKIHPGCQLTLIDDFVTPENVAQMLDSCTDLHALVDCVDDVSAKVAMILAARARSLPLLVCGGAGGKTQSLMMRHADLSLATNDALLARLRNVLRRQHAYPKGGQPGKPKGRVPRMRVPVLWVDEPALQPDAWQVSGESGGGLSCAGYGSSVVVTAAMGLAAAGQIMQWLTAGAQETP